MTGEISSIKIAGISSAVPTKEIDNYRYENLIGKRQFKRQTRLTGAFRRRVSGTRQRSSDLCCSAAKPLLHKLGWEAEDIKVLLMVTQTPNYVFPSTAFLVARQLGIAKDCVCYDINLGCSSFPVGIQTVASLLQNCEAGSKGLLVISDVVKELSYPENKIKKSVITHNMLFGSAGAAIGLEKVQGENGIKFMSKSDPNSFDAIIKRYGHPASMDGSLVFDFAINDVSEDIIKFKEKFSLSENNIDYYVFHQAQNMILNAISNTCNLPEQKELRSIEQFGNTSGTSVAVSICANKEKISEKKNVRLLCCGFGVGLSWGIVYLDIDTENILPIIETDEHYDEDKIPSGPLKKKTVLVFGADTETGECITRYLSSQSAEIVLIGKEKSRLDEISEDLIHKTYVYEQNLQSADDVMTEIMDKKFEHPVLSVILCSETEDPALISKIFEHLNEDEENKIRLIIVKEKSKAKGLQELVEELSGRCHSNKMCVNAVTYDSDKLEMIPSHDKESDWMDEFLQKECPDTMKRPFHIGMAIKYLLNDSGKFISGTVINLDR